jgi:hypothetical protein
LLVVSCVVAASCASSEDAGTSDRKRCTALRDHLVELRLQQSGATHVEAHRAAMTAALGEDFVSRCVELPASEVRCALAAKDPTSALACSPSAEPR